MSHWKEFKIKAWANTCTTPSHLMTLDTRSLQPPSFHDNTVGAQEKMQCTELEASIQAMKWEVGNMVAVKWEWTTQGPQIGRRETQKRCLKEQLCPFITIHIGPLTLNSQASMDGLLDQKPVSVILLTRRLLGQSELIKLSVCHIWVLIQMEKRVVLLKSSLVIFDVSNKTVPLEKSAHDTLQLGMTWIQISHRKEPASRNRTVCPDAAVEMKPSLINHQLGYHMLIWEHRWDYGQANPSFKWVSHSRGQAFHGRVFGIIYLGEDSIPNSKNSL